MSHIISDEGCEIDLSKLINYTMTFQPLQLLLEDVMKRLKRSEHTNEQQSNELTLLRAELDELRRRDADREAQLQDVLLRYSEEEQAEQPSKGGEPQTGGEAEAPKVEAVALEPKAEKKIIGQRVSHSNKPQTTNLQPIWDEIERLKKMVGEFCEAKNNASIEELYHARKRRSTTQVGTAGGADTDFMANDEKGGGEEGRVAVGEVILQRANEVLEVGETSSRSEDPTGETMQPENRPEDAAAKQTSETLEGKMPPPPSNIGLKQERDSTSGASFARGASPDGANAESLFTRMRQDEESIGRLNRVVAEMLSELKGLQKDVDLMRTMGPCEAADAVGSARLEGLENEVEELRRRVDAIEDRSVTYVQDGAETSPGERAQGVTCGGATAQTGRPSEETTTAASVGPIDTGRAPVGGTPPVPVVQARASAPDIRELRTRLNNLENAFRRMNEKVAQTPPVGADSRAEERMSISLPSVGDTAGGRAKQVSEPREYEPTVNADDLERIWRAVRKLQDETKGLGGLCASLENRKQDKGAEQDLSSLCVGGAGDENQLKTDQEDVPKQAVSTLGGNSSAVDSKENWELKERVKDLSKRLNDLQNRLVSVEGNVLNLDDRKADYAGLQRLADDVRSLRQLLEMETSKGGGEGAAATVQKQEEQIQSVQKDIAEQMQQLNAVRDGTSNELGSLRKYVEHIDRCKADAQLVANKAERDYVENALERLMREVEQVLNTTNASLIDTLDKSLNILRDMLDGKAGKEDLINMQRILNEEHDGGGAPDVLMGFRGFRCLGCNRPVDKMRPRSLGSRLQPFVNRLPQNLPPDQSAGHIQDVPLIYNTNKDGKPSSA